MRPIITISLFLLAPTAHAATVLFSSMDTFDGWSLRSVGAASARIATKDSGQRYAELAATRGTVFLSRELPLEQVVGSRLTIGCFVQTEDIVTGPQAAHCGKLHLAIATPAGVEHHRVHFTGNAEWEWQGITADVPSDATRVLLNLGLEGCSGRVGFEQLTVKNDQRMVRRLDLAPVVNADHEQLGLEAFPENAIMTDDIPFDMVDTKLTAGLDCLRLRGIDHPDWPSRTAGRIEVGSGATAIYILHAALSGQGKRESPTAFWTAHIVGGGTSHLSVFEGTDIGAVGHTEDLENWQVAFRKQTEAGKWVTFGVTKWTVGTEPIIESLSCRAYRGAAPVILAVTVVEQPPAPPSEPEQFDEMGEPLDYFE